MTSIGDRGPPIDNGRQAPFKNGQERFFPTRGGGRNLNSLQGVRNLFQGAR